MSTPSRPLVKHLHLDTLDDLYDLNPDSNGQDCENTHDLTR